MASTDADTDTVDASTTDTDNSDNSSDADSNTDLQLVRRGSARANVPLSAFGRSLEDILANLPVNATTVAEHLLPAFIYASEIIPAHYHATTPVKYQATAGMRLLSDTEQDAVYDALYTGLTVSESFVFTSLKRHDIATLAGDLEGFYGAVAANYLKGTIDADLQMMMPPVPQVKPQPQPHDNSASGSNSHDDEHHDQHHHHGPIGALDMGGSSTQIVFLPGMQPQQQQQESCAAVDTDKRDLGLEQQKDSDSDSSTCHTATLAELPSRLNGQDFFATSYLSYGVDQFRTRLWSTWVQEHAAELAQNPDCCDAMRIDNPCTFKGYEIEWEGYTLVGTGDAHECVIQVQRLIPHANLAEGHDAHKLGSHVGGVQHPPVRGKFFAMSLYFFTLDSLRTLSHPAKEAYQALNLSWPTPSISELYNALDGLCGRSWQGDLEEIQHEAHAYTRPEVLPHRCLESVYMVTLLRDGFGFAPESRDITFTFLVDGSEVEWSLGMALVLRAEQSTTLDDNNNDNNNDQSCDADAPSTDNNRSMSIASTYQEITHTYKDPISGLYEELTHQLFAAAS